MSLYIGKMSNRTRRDDLERVFTRFGRCEVRIKDGFGFVIYEFPPNADKALRAVQGRTICGERLTISWSKKQPRAPLGFATGGRSYEAHRGRNFGGRGDYGMREYRRNMNQLDNNDRGRVTSTDMVRENDSDYNREQHRDYREGLPNEGGGLESASVDYGRWGDRGDDMPNDHGFENEVGFERYERYQGYERKREYENSLVAGRSPSPGSPRKKIERMETGEGAHGGSNDSKVKARCYNCGSIGHKKRYCPRGIASDRKFTRFDRGQNSEMNKEDRGEGNLERYESKSRGDVQSGMDREVSGSKNHEMSLKSGSSTRRDKNDRIGREDYKGKKRSRNGSKTSKEHSSKGAQSSVSSPLQSDYTASRSLSISQLSKSQRRNTRSRSRSASYRARSLSSNSRSSSKSHRSRSTSPKSRSRHSFHTSLSASLGQSLPSPPNERQISLKGSLGNATTESGKISVKPGQHGEGDSGSHSVNVNGKIVSMNDGKALSPFNMEDGNGNDLSLQLMSGSPVDMTNPCTPHLGKGVLPDGSLSSPRVEETRELPISSILAKEHMLTPFQKPDSEAPSSSHTCNLTSISAEELSKVLKHYGLTLPNQNESHLSAQDYFGSSRLWPWEVIYYRRLKKGPISTENYARRLAQNREFGIMDKYIRSSSGWGELSQDSTV